MKPIKEDLISLIRKMPDNATIEDIIEQLYVKQKILEGQKQLKTGDSCTHEEAKEILSK